MDGRTEAQGLRPKAKEAQEVQAASSDSQLDREIESAVGIEPSPEFLARVRTRIAAEPDPAGWGVSFEPLWGVAIAGIVLAIVAPQFMRGEAARPQVRYSPVAEVPSRIIEARTAPQAARTASVPRAPRLAVERAESPRTLPLQLSPVLFAEEDRLAFAWFAAAVADGIVPEEKVVQALGEEDMAPLAITSLAIDPLPPLARVEREGEGQW